MASDYIEHKAATDSAGQNCFNWHNDLKAGALKHFSDLGHGSDGKLSEAFGKFCIDEKDKQSGKRLSPDSIFGSDTALRGKLAARPEFNQEAPVNGGNELDKLVHGFKSLFHANETVNDTLVAAVVKTLTPQQMDRLRQEDQAIEQYRARLRERLTGTGGLWNQEKFPDLPKTPMHDEVNCKISNAQEQIIQDVRESMSPADLKRLDKQLADMNKPIQDWVNKHRRRSDATAMIYEPMPYAEPGPAVKDYYARIAETTQKKIQEMEDGKGNSAA